MEVFSINILAIDQARKGAWAVFECESKKLIGTGVFEFDSKYYTYARAVMYIEDIVNIVIKAYDVSAIFIEDIQLRQNVQSFKRLAQLQGVLVNSFERNNYLYDYIAPAQWQNFCNSRGRTSKEQDAEITELEHDGKKRSKILSIQYVKEHFGIDTQDDNLADSICIGWYVVNNIAIEDVKSTKQRKAQKK